MLSKNFYFLDSDFEVNKITNNIAIQIDNIEKKLQNKSKDIEKEILGTIRNIYEEVLSIIYERESVPGDTNKDKFYNFKDMFSRSFSSQELLALNSIYPSCSTLGAHFSRDLMLPKFVVLQQFYNLWIILKFLYKKIFKINISDDKFIDFYDTSNNVLNSVVSKELLEYEQNQSSQIKPDADAKLYQICTLLEDKNRTYIIPIYQRGYKWDKSNIKVFINDIENAAKTVKTHYFGVIAAKKIHNPNIAMKDKIKILDGQQRLTTSLLFLCACRDVLELKNEEIKKIQILKRFFLDRELNGYFYNPGGSEKLNEDFNNILSRRKTISKSNFSLYSDNYDYMYDYLKSKSISEILELCSAFINCFKIALVSFDEKTFTIKNEMEIFENINSKGKSLSPYELIKNYIFNLCHENYLNQEEKSISAEFTTNIMMLIDNREDYFLNFVESLIHYFSGKEIEGKGEEKTRNILSEFRKIIDEHYFKNEEILLDSKSFKDLLNWLRRYLKIWTFMRNAERLQKYDYSNLMNITYVIDLLNDKKKTPLYPLLYLIFDMFQLNDIMDYKKNKSERDTFTQTFINLINPLIKNFIVKGQGDSTIATIYFEEINNARLKIINNLSFIDSIRLLKDLIKSIDLKAPPIIDVKNSLLTYNDWDWAIQLLLYELEWRMIGWPKIGEYIKRNKPTIEHIMPETLSVEWENDLSKWCNISNSNVKEQFKTYLNKIGNFMIVSNSKNSGLGNATFDIKQKKLKEKYEASPLFKNKDENIDISNKEKWTLEYINNRTEALTLEIMKLFEY